MITIRQISYIYSVLNVGNSSSALSLHLAFCLEQNVKAKWLPCYYGPLRGDVCHTVQSIVGRASQKSLQPCFLQKHMISKDIASICCI